MANPQRRRCAAFWPADVGSDRPRTHHQSRYSMTHGGMDMGKIRHIAIRCEDTDKTAQWLQEAIGLQFVQRRGSGAVDLTDGDVNVTLLPLGLGTGDTPARPGFEHIGVSVADDEAARQRLLAAGA